MKKREKSARLMTAHQAIFHCPVCRGEMSVREASGMVCTQGHRFDIARQGYINLTVGPVRSSYGKDLFDARQNVIQSGAFDPLHAELISRIEGPAGDQPAPRYLLDAGCGEGSHLAAVCRQLEDRGQPVLGLGLDLAKSGIQAAAREYGDCLWAVADLADPPLRDASFDVLLNILSPASYGTFRRLLRPGGTILKVVPGEEHLRELREEYDTLKDGGAYSNRETVHLFSRQYPDFRQELMTWTVPVDDERLAVIARMSPLSWHRTPDAGERLFKRGIRDITFSVVVLEGQAGPDREPSVVSERLEEK